MYDCMGASTLITQCCSTHQSLCNSIYICKVYLHPRSLINYLVLLALLSAIRPETIARFPYVASNPQRDTALHHPCAGKARRCKHYQENLETDAQISQLHKISKRFCWVQQHVRREENGGNNSNNKGNCDVLVVVRLKV